MLHLALFILLAAPALAQTLPEPAEPFTAETARAQEEAAWATVPDVLARITVPSFPDRTCRVTDYGAVPGDSADDRPGIMGALRDCAAQGGGRVVIPPGDWLSNGPVHYESNIDFHLEAGATLRFGTDPAFYTPLVLTRWEGTFLYNYSPLVYANGKENIALTGRGTLDGQAEGTWSLWKRDNDGRNQEADKAVLRRMGAEGVPVEERVFGDGVADTDGDGQNDGDGQPHYLRPSLVQFFESRNVLVEGVTLRGSPFWTTHLVGCENVTARGLTIRSGTTNDDGFNPESSRFVLIEDSDIWTHDDPIAIKAGRDADGRAYPGTAFVVIRNTRLRSTVGGAMSIGSEMSGGVEGVFIADNVGENGRGRGLYLKSNRDRGGFIRHVYVRDLDLTGARTGFEITTDYKGLREGAHPPAVHDVFLRDVRIWNASERSVRLLGQPTVPVRRVLLDGVHLRGSDTAPELRSVEDVLARDVTVGGEAWRPDSIVEESP
ncbi:MAG: glycoside hydrolase family 28 protein [Bacteroidota bacterium]